MSDVLEFRVARRMPVANDEVWRVLGDFGTEHRWTKTVTHCRRDTADVRVGTVRDCALPRPLLGRTRVREQVTEFDRGRALAYLLEGSAGPFASAGSRWSTAPIAGTTTVTVEGRFTARSAFVRRFAWPLIRPVLARMTGGVLEELECHLLGGQSGSRVARSRAG